jgi:hypothetical protein
MRKSEQFKGKVGDLDPTTAMQTVHQKKDRYKRMIRRSSKQGGCYLTSNIRGALNYRDDWKCKMRFCT